MGKRGNRAPLQNHQPNRNQSVRFHLPAFRGTVRMHGGNAHGTKDSNSNTTANSSSNNTDVAFEQSFKLFNETVDNEMTKLMQNGWKTIATELKKMIWNVDSAKALDERYRSQIVNSSNRQEGTSSQHATSESSAQIEVDEIIGSLRTVTHKFNDYLTEMSLRSDISATTRKSYLTKIAADLKAIDLPALSSTQMNAVNTGNIVVKTEPNSSEDVSRDETDHQSKRARYFRNSKKQ